MLRKRCLNELCYIQQIFHVAHLGYFWTFGCDGELCTWILTYLSYYFLGITSWTWHCCMEGGVRFQFWLTHNAKAPSLGLWLHWFLFLITNLFFWEYLLSLPYLPTLSIINILNLVASRMWKWYFLAVLFLYFFELKLNTCLYVCWHLYFFD